jgi:hypothetical protein
VEEWRKFLKPDDMSPTERLDRIVEILATAVIFCFVTGIIWLVVSGKKQDNLVAPGLQQDQQVSTPSPTPSIKTFQFNSSTDLKVELEKVDPKVLDSDIE